MSLLRWIEQNKMRISTPEVPMLFTVIGSLSYPELYLRERPYRKWTQL